MLSWAFEVYLLSLTTVTLATRGAVTAYWTGRIVLVLNTLSVTAPNGITRLFFGVTGRGAGVPQSAQLSPTIPM